ncbi:MBL fold metallo-hydrolase [Candidatus Micrarchaeota archaeon]|nr:MBL fold metallo-hydrolase [Candidatus Micrarchaeota archaeon]
MNPLSISFYGACREVGRAAVLVEGARNRVLLDYGMKIEPVGQPGLPLPVQGSIDGLIITHAHLDHSGASPMLYKHNETQTFITPPSIPLIDLLVQDSIKVGQLKGVKPLFFKQHLRKLMRNVVPAPYGHERKAGLWNFSLHDAGHIMGSSWINLMAGETTIAYTGDIKLEKTRLHAGAETPKSRVDVLVTESTYGDRPHPPRRELERQFFEACLEKVEDGGIVLVPSFAVGRAQEVASILIAHGFDHPIRLDGMSRKAAEIYLQYPDYVRDYGEFSDAMRHCDWVVGPRARERALEEPGVIISTAGFLQGGPAVGYALKLRERAGSAIFFVGYQPPDSPAYGLLKLKRFQTLDYDLDFSAIDVRHFDFSAHAGREELHQLIKEFRPSLCFVTHGEADQAQALAEWVKKNIGCNAIAPRMGEKFDLKKML